MKTKIKLSALVFCHNEGALLTEAVKSLDYNLERAQRRFTNFEYEKLLVVDSLDKITREYVNQYKNKFSKIIEMNTKDLGINRNIASYESANPIISFLDADDIWGLTWLEKGISKLLRNKKDIVHPEFNFYFEGKPRLMVSKNSTKKNSATQLNRQNLWTSGIITFKETIEMFPFKSKKELNKGDFEDWEWNRRTLENNVDHRIANNTFHFIRQRKNSLTRMEKFSS